MKRSLGTLIVAAVALSACQSGSGPFSKSGGGSSSDLPPELATTSVVPAMAVTRFSDVPLPSNVSEVMERSYIYESHTLQIGRMVYETPHDVGKVAQFYIEEAPKHNWHLTNVLEANGTQLMFEKPGKRMWLNITPRGLTNRRAELVINLVPDGTRERTAMEPLGDAR